MFYKCRCRVKRSSLSGSIGTRMPFSKHKSWRAIRSWVRGYVYGSVTKRVLCILVQSAYECKTRREERGPCPPRGEADAHNSPSMPSQDALPCAFEAVH